MNTRAVAIIIKHRKVLLVHRIREGREYWILPGGSIAHGESPEQACCREAKEETGLCIRILKHVLTWKRDGRTEVYFVAQPAGGSLALGEPERSRHFEANQYMLEWVGLRGFNEINFLPVELRSLVADRLSKDTA